MPLELNSYLPLVGRSESEAIRVGGDFAREDADGRIKSGHDGWVGGCGFWIASLALAMTDECSYARGLKNNSRNFS